MSADTTKDVSLIQDEDILKKMWQDTEDFGRKKEIRSHMYKLREQRLRDFYNNGEVTTTEIRTNTTGKSCNASTHADSLADHSFLSLKSKEIRDSESPTRDVSYKVAEKRNDQGWQISSSEETSADGKSHTSTKVATKVGTQPIEGGKIDYAAKNQHVASVYQDGDDKNFTRSVGAQSNTAIKQEAVGGDEHSSFKTSSSKTSSLSKVVSEHHSTVGDNLKAGTEQTTLISRKVYADDAPVELMAHPGYVDGKTKVIRETKTLPDGTTVSTTRYETRGGATSKTESTSKHSTSVSSQQQSCTSRSTEVQSSSSNTVSGQKRLRDSTKAIEYVPQTYQDTRAVSDHYDTGDAGKGSFVREDNQNHTRQFDNRDDTQISERKVRTYADSRDIVDDRSEKSVSLIRENKNLRNEQVEKVSETSSKIMKDVRNEEIANRNVTSHFDITSDKPQEPNNSISTTTTTKVITVRHEPVENISQSTTVLRNTDVRDKKTASDKFITTEREHVQDTRKVDAGKDYHHPSEAIKKVPDQSSAQPEKYQQPDRRQPLKPGKSELHQPTKPTEGQYDTTYRTDYTTKKISVEVSPTHDAFARSLRAVTPERITSKCSSPSRGSTRSLRSSNPSLRSSASPEKVGQPDRYARAKSPKKSADRFASSETITYSSNKSSPERRFPAKSTSPQRTFNTDALSKTTKRVTDTVTRRNKIITNGTTDSTDNITRYRSPSPISTIASEIEYIRHVNDLVTDLDDETITVSGNITATGIFETRPNTLEITKKTKKVTERSPTSPLIDMVSPTKKSPAKELARSSSLRSPTKSAPSKYPPEERQLKRTDTYEERCRQILGLKETTERRRSSLERNSIRRSSLRDSVSSPVTDSPKRIIKSPEKARSPTKDVSNISEFQSPRKSPSKESPKISEFPSQIRKSTVKEPLESYTKRKSPVKEMPTSTAYPAQTRKSPVKEPLECYTKRKSPVKDAPKISEFPSQVRKTPEKTTLEPYPERKSPTKSSPKISEFPSQIRKSPVREPLGPYPEKISPSKDTPKISEFPSQIKKSPVREPLEPYAERKRPTKEASKLSEFPSQIRKSPVREPLEPYPEKMEPSKHAPTISEFPSQVRKSPVREPLQPYPGRMSPTKETPKLSEFPSQIRRSPERESFEPYPERKAPIKEAPRISEVPTQIRKSPEREPHHQNIVPSQVRVLASSAHKVTPKAKGSSSTSSSDDEGNMEEVIAETSVTPVESRVPVKEEEATKKFISQLCREEEIERTGSIRTTADESTRDSVNKQELIRKILPQQPKTSISDIQEFIEREIETSVRLRDKSPEKISAVKKPTQEITNVEKSTTKTTKKVPKNTTPDANKVDQSKFVDKTEYTDQFSKIKSKTADTVKGTKQKSVEKITLLDIENLNKTVEDKTVHIRTHRIDDTVNKNKKTFSSKILVNGDVNRKPKPTSKTPTKTYTSPTQKPSQPKPDIPKHPITQTRYVTTIKKTINTPEVKPKPIGPVGLTNKATTKTTVKSTNLDQIISKPTISTPKFRKVDQITSRKPLVTTTITVVPKDKTTSLKKTTKTTTTKTVTKVNGTPKPGRPKKTPNGHISDTEDEESIADSLEDSTTDVVINKKTTKTTEKRGCEIDDDVVRTTRRTVINKTTSGKTRPDTPKNKKPEQRCITTKTVIINNKDAETREIVIDLQRSKSSREPTPDRLCPVPLSSDEESSGLARYPDEVEEPEDGGYYRQPKRLSDIPIPETETTNVSEVLETDVTKKKSTIYAPTIRLTQNNVPDECLLSVSDKVTKFISTAEQLITPQQLPDRPKSPLCKNYEDTITSKVSDKISHFTKPASKPSKQGHAPKVSRPEFKEVDETIKDDDCLLSVSDKVSKFITTADKLTKIEYKKPVSLAKIDVKPKEERKSPEKRVREKTSPERKVPERASPERKAPTRFVPTLPTECVTIETDEQMFTRRTTTSPDRKSPGPQDRTSHRGPSNKHASVKTETEETYSRRDSSPKFQDTTPRSGRRPSQEETKIVLSSTGRLRSTESIKKAKALFENINKEQDIKQRDILSRPSVFEGRRQKTPDLKTEARKKLTYSDEETTDEINFHRLQSTKLVLGRIATSNKSPERDRSKSPEKDSTRHKDSISPHYMLPLDRNVSDGLRPNKSPERERSSTPDRGSSKEKELSTSHDDIPHYMLPLDRTLRPHSPHREGIPQTAHHPTASDQLEPKSTKFGVTLKRVDSGKETTSTTTHTAVTERRKSSIVTEKRITEEEIEDIFDVETLEELLIKVVGYELRRKIRAQIRLVKKLITENSLETYVSQRKFAVKEISKPKQNESPRKVDKKIEFQTQYTRKTSPERVAVDNKSYERRDQSVERTTEYQSAYSYNERKTSFTSRERSPDTKQTREASPSKEKAARVSPEKTKPTRSSPERKVTTKTEKKETFTSLRKTLPVNNAVGDDKPEWARQRNLRKASEGVPPVGRIATAKNTTTSKKETVRASPTKEIKATDLITSSYGVGPTDENGTPLFGLRALRAQNKSSTTKVQGTVITSEFHSENGAAPVGQVSVTKYSTDPRDLGNDRETVDVDNKGLTSITTQKFGYKDTPALKTLTGKQKKITNEDESTTSAKTTKVTRRNSVKALSKKFIDNAVETLKSERQTSYPKAGLILRTSSFKDSGSGSDDASQAERECESITVRSSSSTTTTSKTVTGGDTFLTNKSRVSGVQDVISRMRPEELREGDTEEDFKARDLLNKFIGSQVILSGMEATNTGSMNGTSTGSVKRTTKITTTVTEGGKPVTKTRVFQSPSNQEELDTIWDEQTLRLLLEQSTDYEERRLIRARLWQVMAEQEACTELVEKASQDQSSGALEGESQLLPLLQGLLEAPENEHLADSGTESGEDQRSGLIAEVQIALDKLSASLRSDATDVTPDRRSSLLQLVTKLQAGLASTTPKLERRLSSGAGRFNRRRDRQARHTVGVSSEELADARRLIEEISLTPSQSKHNLDLRKQNSESSVNSNSSSFNKISGKSAVRNATAKPFSSSSNSISNASSSVQTPTEPSEHLELLFSEEPALLTKILDTTSNSGAILSPELQKVTQNPSDALLDLRISDVDNIKSVHQAVAAAAARKKVNSESVEEETEEEDTSTVKEQNAIEKTPSPLQENPIYTKPVAKSGSSNSLSYDEKVSRFNTQHKKLKMKRANTIDIPKPLQFYEDDDSESEDEAQKRRHSYYALRGPIRVGDPVPKIMPNLEAKTKSDKKFLDFISKNTQDSDSVNKGSLWSYQSNKTPMWGSKFGNIKNTFEKPFQNSSAKNFWKTQDDAATVNSSSTQQYPKISRKSARNLQQMFEEKQRQSSERTRPDEARNIVTGTLTVKTEPERAYKLVPQPLPVNKFSHAPQSAFKPIPKKIQTQPEPKKEIVKTEIKEKSGDVPLYLYSPKPVFNSQSSSSTTSPITSKPWIANATEHGGRVLSLAAKKFDVPQLEPSHQIKPRKLSKEYNKMFTQPQTPSDKISAPYLAKGMERKNNTVRKLSAEYDNIGNKTPEYSTTTSVKYQPVQTQYVPPFRLPQNSTSPQTHPTFTPQNVAKETRTPSGTLPNSPNPGYQANYRITYEQPRHTTKHYNAQYKRSQSHNESSANKKQEFQPVNYSIRYDQPGVYRNATAEPQAQVYQHIPVKEKDPHCPEQQYTSSVQFTFKPKQQAKITEPSSQLPKLQTQLSAESVHEYTAISSKVMTGPVGQQAVTVRQKSPMSRNEHDMEAAFSLKSSLQQIGKKDVSKSPTRASTFTYRTSPVSPNSSFKYKTPAPQPAGVADSSKTRDARNMYPNNKPDVLKTTSPTNMKPLHGTFEPKAPMIQNENKTYGVVKPMQHKPSVQTPIYNNVTGTRKLQQESFETNEQGQNVVHSKFHIPVINVAPSSPGVPPSHAQVLSKSDSWHQICMGNQPTNRASPNGPPSGRTVLKSKSSHSLAVPQKQFEAGMSKEELVQKKRTIEAYFSGGNKSPHTTEPSRNESKVVKRSINRIKTSEKVSAYHQPSGLARSRTLPDIVCPDMLDESNVEKAFDELFKAAS